MSDLISTPASPLPVPRPAQEAPAALSSGFSLQGQAIELQPLGVEHAEALFAIARDDRSSFTYTHVPASLAAMTDYLQLAVADARQGTAVPFVTKCRRSGQVIGTTRFCVERWRWPDAHPLTPPEQDRAPDAVEIGWTWLAPAWQRSGANREAKFLMLQHAFETWRVHRVSLCADERNLRSRRAIESLGCQLDGVLRAHIPSFDGHIRNSAFYSLLASEWPRARAQILTKLQQHGAYPVS